MANLNLNGSTLNGSILSGSTLDRKTTISDIIIGPISLKRENFPPSPLFNVGRSKIHFLTYMVVSCIRLSILILPARATLKRGGGGL